jgi:hypothetical protein
MPRLNLGKDSQRALVLGWDALPLEIQIRLLRDASLMDHGFPNTTMLPKTILAFIEQHKEGPSPFQAPKQGHHRKWQFAGR